MDAAAASYVSHSWFLNIPTRGVAPILEREVKQFTALTLRKWGIGMRQEDNQLHSCRMKIPAKTLLQSNNQLM